MTDQYLASGLRTWLKDTETWPDDARRSTDEVMARVEEAGQRGRWWPLPAFDRPVSTSPSRGLAPAPIPVTNGRTRPRGSTMFSAVKFIAAGVIVALFGGFLLAGVLTTQRSDVLPGAVTASPSPTANVDILPGVTLSVEEVEPGVYRVTGDGVRDLTSVRGQDIVAGYDGGIWLPRVDGFLRLGSDVSHAWPAESTSEVEECIFEVAPDGTMWAMGCGGLLRSTDGEEWTVQPCPDGSTDCGVLTVAPDGTLWTSWSEGGRLRVGHLGPTGWQALDGDIDPGVALGGFFLTDAGDLYGVGVDWGPVLWRYEDGVWQEQGLVLNVDVGPDGTVWADMGPGWGDPALRDDQVGLARLAGGEWELWASADILPDIRFGPGYFDYEFEVAPDGSLWFSLWRSDDDSDPRDLDSAECDGLARFDGETLDRFLPGRCLLMDIATDGSVWVLAADEGALAPREGGFADDQTWDLYVITPEAVAASE